MGPAGANYWPSAEQQLILCAALARDGRDHDQCSARRLERGDQPVDQRGAHLRHVAETDDRAVGIRRHRLDAGLERGRQPVGEIRIVREGDRQPGQRMLDALALMPGDDDHRLGARGERMFGDDAHQRLAVDLFQ